jgi:uncharacterized protein with HEPN domain
LEVIGEAVKRVPEDVRLRHASIPWREIAETRNILIHEYYGVDLELMWATVTSRIPELKDEVVAIIEEMN